MLNFVQNIQYYMMFEVMEPTWHILEKNLKLVSEGHKRNALFQWLQVSVHFVGGI